MNPNPADQRGPDAYLDAGVIAKAYEAHSAAHEALRNHDTKAEAVRAELTEAQTARAALLRQQADGAAVAAEQVAAAERAIADAQHRQRFLADTADILRQRAADASTAVEKAAGVAALPIAREGAKRRLAAARRIAEAQAALKAAEADYDDATRFFQIATSRGWRPSRDVAVALTPPTRPQTLDETHRMVTLRGTPQSEESLFRRAGLLDTAEPAAAA